MNSTFEHIRTWEDGDGNGYRLELYDTFQRRHGKDILAYEFYYRDVLVFEGSDFGCAPMHAIDSDRTIGALLSFLSLKPGDTDAEYFESYTPEQMAFAEAEGENLSCYVEQLETA